MPQKDSSLDTNQCLADVYAAHVRQMIIVGHIMWQHEVGGDWFIKHVFGEA